MQLSDGSYDVVTIDKSAKIIYWSHYDGVSDDSPELPAHAYTQRLDHLLALRQILIGVGQ